MVSGECPRCGLGLQDAALRLLTMASPRRNVFRESGEVAAHFSKQVVSNKKSSLKPSCISNPARKVRASEMSTVAGGEGRGGVRQTSQLQPARLAGGKKKLKSIQKQTAQSAGACYHGWSGICKNSN